MGKYAKKLEDLMGKEWCDKAFPPQLIIFDKDGTLTTKRGGGDPPIPNHVDEQIALPGVVEKCDELRAQGHTLAIASNQGGVAFGYLSYTEACRLVAHAADLIKADLWELCQHHPKATGRLGHECPRRKPAPGMLLSIMRATGFDAADTIMVGDMESDKQAAEAAGVRFVWAKDFFGWEEDDAHNAYLEVAERQYWQTHEIRYDDEDKPYIKEVQL